MSRRSPAWKLLWYTKYQLSTRIMSSRAPRAVVFQKTGKSRLIATASRTTFRAAQANHSSAEQILPAGGSSNGRLAVQTTKKWRKSAVFGRFSYDVNLADSPGKTQERLENVVIQSTPAETQAGESTIGRMTSPARGRGAISGTAIHFEFRVDRTVGARTEEASISSGRGTHA